MAVKLDPAAPTAGTELLALIRSRLARDLEKAGTTRDGALVVELAHPVGLEESRRLSLAVRSIPGVLYADMGRNVALPGEARSAVKSSGGATPLVGQLVVKFRAGSPRAKRMTEAPGANADVAMLSRTATLAFTRAQRLTERRFVLTLPHALPADEAQAYADRLAALPDVEYAEPDLPVSTMATPNDPRFATEQWNLQSGFGINMPTAWNTTTGNPGVTIAVIDSGVLPHPELLNRLLPGVDMITDPARAEDGNGRDGDPTDPGGYGGSCSSGTPISNTWHGTLVTGIIAAAANNAEEIAGINWISKVVPVRAIGRCGGVSSDVADAIKWAAGINVDPVGSNPNPAKVINISLGIASATCPSDYQDAINAALARGVTIVVAAGNSNTDPSGTSPANCAGVISVASTNNSGTRSSFSNYGPTVDLSAPGGEPGTGIPSTHNAGSATAGAYTISAPHGTSFAAPHVAAAASLLISLKDFAPFQVYALLAGASTPVPGCTGCGYGRINVASALASAGAVVASTVGSLDAEFGDGGFRRLGNIAPQEPLRAAAILPYGTAYLTVGTSGVTGQERIKLLPIQQSSLLPGATLPVQSSPPLGAARGAAVDSLGRILVCGWENNGPNRRAIAMRFNTDLSVDATYGTAGRVSIAVGTASQFNGCAVSGDLLTVAGEYTDGGGSAFGLVARLDSAGVPDVSFNGGAPLSVGSPGEDVRFNAVALAAPNTVLAGVRNNGAFRAFHVMRLTATGAADATFDGDGVKTFAVGAGHAAANAVLVQPGGKIVVAGDARDAGANDRFGVARMDATGALDATLAAGGIEVYHPGGTGVAGALAYDTGNNRVFVAGSAFDAGRGKFGAIIYGQNGGRVSSGYVFGDNAQSQVPMALLANGASIAGVGTAKNPTTEELAAFVLDTSGLPPSGVPAPIALKRFTEAVDVAVDTSGRIVAAGHSQGADFSFDSVIARFTPLGAIDTSFNGTGHVRADLSMLCNGSPGRSHIEALATQADGKIVVAVRTDPRPGFCVVRYLESGALDTGFGTGGRVTTAYSGDSWATAAGSRLAIQPDGKIVALRTTCMSATGAMLARYTINGVADAAFGTGGLASVSVGGGFGTGDCFTNMDMRLAPDGKIVLSGTYGFDATLRSGLWLRRLNSAGAVDSGFGSGGRYDFAADSAQSGAYLNNRPRIAVGSNNQVYFAVGGRLSCGACVSDGLVVGGVTNAGQVDTGFGLNGRDVWAITDPYTLQPIGFTPVTGLAVQPSGKLIVASPRTAARYTATGQRDTNFGLGGRINLVPLGLGEANSNRMVLTAAGSIVSAGGYDAPDDPPGFLDLFVAQYLAGEANASLGDLSTTALGLDEGSVGSLGTAIPVTFTNNGGSPILIRSIFVRGHQLEGDFTLTGHTCPGSLSPGATCTIYIAFTPQGAGPRTGTLWVNTNSSLGNRQVTLTGTGLAQTQSLASITVTPGTPSATAGQSISFTATGSYTNGSTRILSSGSGTWVQRAPRPIATYGSGGAFSNGKLYVIGGFQFGGNVRVDVYDPVTDLWSQRANVPIPSYQAFQFGAVGVGVNGKIYVAGGDTGGYGQLSNIYEYDPVADTWATKAPMPGGGRYATGGAAIGNKHYVVGGSDGVNYLSRLEIYDIASNTWTTGPSMAGARAGAAAVALNNKLYVIGGSDPSGALSSVEIFDPSTNSWSAGVSMPLARGGPAAVLRGRIYIAGENAGSETATHMFDPTTNTWTQLANLNTPRHATVIAADEAGNRVFVVGGYFNGNKAENEELQPGEVSWSSANPSAATITGGGVATGVAGGTTNIVATVGTVNGSTLLTVTGSAAAFSAPVLSSLAVSPASPTILPSQTQQFFANGTFSDGSVRTLRSTPSTWTARAPRPRATYSGGAIYTNGKLYTLAGFMFGGNVNLEAYDPVTNTWSDRASAPLPGGYALQNFGMALGINGRIYVAGGDTGGSGQLATMLEYDPASNTWATKTAMPSGARFGQGAAALGGKIYVAGGADSGGNYLTRLEIYDIASNSWTVGAPMNVARSGAGVVAMNGLLYVVGGGNLSGSRADVEVYNPGSNTWGSGVSMPLAMSGPAVVLRGRIYLAGGGGGPENTAIAFNPSTGLWASLPNLPTGRRATLLAADDAVGRLWVVGGYLGSNRTENEELQPHEVDFTSGTPTVAGINVAGLAQAVASGTTVITATAGSISANTTLTVNSGAAVSTTTVVSSQNPSPLGIAVTFTATVSGGAGVPTGNVSFKDGGTNIPGCVAVTLGSSEAQCTTSGLGGGSHSITAAYSGSAAYMPSTSAAIVQEIQSGFLLTVNKTGAGSGTVTASPNGINCGADCSETYFTGTEVTLTALPAPGSSFTGWSGACVGNAACVVVMSSVRTVNANFAPIAPGNVDPSFGRGGVASFGVGPGDDHGVTFRRLPNGQFLHGGGCHNGVNLDFCVARYHADGTLDAAFGTGGRVISPLGTGDDVGYALLVQPDGKFILGGMTSTTAYGNANDFALVRYLADGSLDPAFGTGGVAVTAITAQNEEIYALALQPDGKIVAAGRTHNDAYFGIGPRDVVLARFHPDGILDTSFGCATPGTCTGFTVTPVGMVDRTIIGEAPVGLVLQPDGKPVVFFGLNGALRRYLPNGTLDTAFGSDGVTGYGANAYFYGGTIQPDGKLIAVGAHHNGANFDGLVVRFETNGSLDAGFASGGALIQPYGPVHDVFGTAVVQPDGKIVAAGLFYNGSYHNPFAIRLNPNGSYDTSFNGNGAVDTSFGGNGYWYEGLVVQPDGAIVLGGYAAGPTFTYDFATMRFLPGGALDPAFGTAGKRTVDMNTGAPGLGGHPRVVRLLADGRVLVAGFANGSDTGGDFAIARLMADGRLDPSFGSGGKVVTAVTYGLDHIYGMEIDATGRIVVAGLCYPSGNADFCLARYLADGTLDTSFGTGGFTMTSIGANNDNAYALAIDSAGRIVVAGGCAVPGFQFCLARYTPAGQLDLDFGCPTGAGTCNGKITLGPIAGNDSIVKLAIGAGDTVVAAGVCKGPNRLCVSRHQANGVLDGSFNFGGPQPGTLLVPALSSGQNEGVGLVLLPDGKIVLGGECVEGDGRFCVARLNANGSFDTSFNGTGYLVAPAPGGDVGAHAIVGLPGGRVVLAGECAGSTGYDFCLARVLPNGTLDATYGTGGWVVHEVTPGEEAIHDVQVQADGRLVVTGLGATAPGGRWIVSRYESEDVTPDAFNFTPQGGVGFGVTVTSAPLTPAGFVAPALVTVASGSYCVSSTASCSCDVQAFTTARGAIAPGQSICARHTSAAVVNSSVTTTVSIGPLSGTFTSTTQLAPATISVQTSGSPTLFGNPVTFTATVSGGFGAPTGTLTLRDGGAAITGCSAMAIAAGQAQCTTSALPAGSRSITAEYSGNATYQPGTSPPLTQVVNNAYLLSISRTGTGTGTVSSTPGGIGCGSDCTEYYAPATSVTLTASADAGSVFSGWAGGGCAGIGACVVPMNANATITATFTIGAQGPLVLAASTYFGGAGNQRAKALSIGGGALYIGGEHDSAGNIDGLAARLALPLANNATPTWTKLWPVLSGNDHFEGVSLSSEGLYFGGASFPRTTDTVGGKEAKALVTKFNPADPNAGPGFAGAIWDRQTPPAPGRFAYGGTEYFYALTTNVESAQTYVYATGFGQFQGNGGRMFIAKLDAAGNILWIQDDSAEHVSFRVTVGLGIAAANGFVYVTGYSLDDGSYRPYLRKYDTAGNLIWTRRSAGVVGFTHGIALSGGAIYLAGLTGQYNAASDFLVEKWDEAGNRLWTRTFDRNGTEDQLRGITLFAGFAYAAGWTRGSTAGGLDAVVLKIDPTNGDLVSTTLHGGTGDDMAHAIGSDGTNLVVVGESSSFGGSGMEAMVLSFAPSAGAFELAVSRNGSGTGTVAAVTPAGGITCGVDCSESYTTGTSVTLAATPDAGSTFASWSGCDSVSTNQCTVTMNAVRTVTATFNLVTAARKPRDANASGHSDIFWSDPSGQAALWLMNGTSIAGSALMLGPSTGWSMSNVTGDYNGDGRADILWRHTSGMWAIWLLDGTNVVGSGVILGPSTGWDVTHVADFDGDGRSDLLWRNTDGSVAMWLLNGLGVTGSAIVFGPNATWNVTHTADLDNDARADIVWRNNDGSVAGWLMNGTSATVVGFIFGPGTTWQVIGAGDFDGDGRTDLVWKDAGGQVSIFLMNGLQITNSAIVYNGGGFNVTQVADFNGDARADLLYSDAGGQVAIWLMNGFTVTGSAVIYGGGSTWQVAFTGDYDGDGRADILWRDGGGQVAIWTLNGTAVTGSALIFGGNGGWVAGP